jgi:hypothetical protein
MSASAREGSELPAGVGLHTGRREQAERLGFAFHHVADYGS